MIYCRKCGAQLKDNDEFCFKCGETVDQEASKLSEANMLPLPQTKEESISVAEKLKDEYASVEKLLKEINENETILSRPVVIDGRRYTGFRFFWPFLIYGYLVLMAVYIVGAIICVLNEDSGDMVLVMFIGLAAAGGLMIWGGSLAGRKRDRLNKELSDEEYEKRKRVKELVERTNELKIKYNNKVNEFSGYHQYVPYQFRSKQHMERVVFLLETNKAENFSDAIRLLDY